MEPLTLPLEGGESESLFFFAQPPYLPAVWSNQSSLFCFCFVFVFVFVLVEIPLLFVHALSNTPALFRVRVEGDDLRQADDVARAIAAKYTPPGASLCACFVKEEGQVRRFFLSSCFLLDPL